MDAAEPKFSTQWEREDHERQKRGEEPRGPRGPRGATMTEACENTDRELWREREGDYYADSIHVTKDGGIGINFGGTVIVMPLCEWFALASGATRVATRKLETKLGAAEDRLHQYETDSLPILRDQKARLRASLAEMLALFDEDAEKGRIFVECHGDVLNRARDLLRVVL